ncbi:peptidase M24 [Microbacterium sp. WCS2018Hpa-23]|uniref:M24 family metallopeptidase n=1 Tax=Microbacterium sp. WCS2018Hpa-23 TaxID=3073634 RepID=UPI00288340C1|nr:peptidase M24 [Microbacterium sp. WCS2018Hpa-23]
MVGSSKDRIEKQDRVSRVRRGAGAPILITSHEAVSWYLEGVRTHVSLAGPPVLAVRADADGDTLFVADNEADRLIAEELLPPDVDRIVRVPWWTPPAVAAAEDAGSASAVGEAAVAGELRAARARMLPAETSRYRSLGRDLARAVTDALAGGVRPESSEWDAASVLAAGLVSRGIDPLVVLVTGAARVSYRHPLPTAALLGERAMIVVCGRRDGLIANATRWIGAGVDDEPILGVERAFLDASVPGARLDEAFDAGCAAYERFGFDPEEWRRHHQGGPTGYAGRDPRATASTLDPLVENQAFAWNPSAPGAKVEDTMLRSADGWEVLTVDERWPSVEYGGMRRPTTRGY